MSGPVMENSVTSIQSTTPSVNLDSAALPATPDGFASLEGHSVGISDINLIGPMILAGYFYAMYRMIKSSYK